MQLAVTGANGFVGRHVVEHAAHSGWAVDGIVRSEEAARVVSAAGGSPVGLSTPDVEALARAFEGARAVVHLAQIGAERGGQTYDEVNVGLTERVLEACRRAGVPRLVFFSGLGVARYGMKPRCTNPYFLSKLTAETTLFRSGLEGVVFRPSYVVGPGDAFVPAVLARDGGRARWSSPATAPTACSPSPWPTPRPWSSPRPRARAGAFPTVFDLVGPEPLSYAPAPRTAGAGGARRGAAPGLRRARDPPGRGGPAGPGRGVPGNAPGRARLPPLRRGGGSDAPRRPPRPSADAPRRGPGRGGPGGVSLLRLPPPGRGTRSTWPWSAPGCRRSSWPSSWPVARGG